MPWEMKEKLDTKLAKEAGGLKLVAPPANVAFLIKVNFDGKIEKAAMADPLLRQDFEDAGQDTIALFVEFVGKKMKATETQVAKLLDQNKLAEAIAANDKMNKDIEMMRLSAQQFGVQQVNKAWTELQKKKKEYLKYKIKIVVTVSAAVAGLAVSISLMAAAPWTGGASAALSIIGMINAAVTISKELVAAGMEVETAAKSLGVQIKAVEAIFKASRAAGHANEISGTVLTKLLGQAQPSIKGCTDWMGRCENKLNGLEIKNHALAKSIQSLINAMPLLEGKIMADVQKQLKTHPSPKAMGQLGQVKKQYHNAIDAAEDKITASQKSLLAQVARFKAANVVVTKLSKAVKELEKNRGVPYRILDNVLLLYDLALTPLSGNNLVSGAADIASNVAPTAALFVIDRIQKLASEGTVLE